MTLSAEYRIERHPEIGFDNPETALQIKAFFEGSLTSVVAVHDLTNRGNVFIQYVAI